MSSVASDCRLETQTNMQQFKTNAFCCFFYLLFSSEK